MKIIPAVFLLITLGFFSCNKKDNGNTVTYYKAEVVNTDDINCRRPLISIDPSDTAAVSLITGVYTQLYVASQLPSSLNNTGQKLNISIAKFGTGEDFVCGTIGVSYSHINVITALSRN